MTLCLFESESTCVPFGDSGEADRKRYTPLLYSNAFDFLLGMKHLLDKVVLEASIRGCNQEENTQKTTCKYVLLNAQDLVCLHFFCAV